MDNNSVKLANAAENNDNSGTSLAKLIIPKIRWFLSNGSILSLLFTTSCEILIALRSSCWNGLFLIVLQVFKSQSIKQSWHGNVLFNPVHFFVTYILLNYKWQVKTLGARLSHMTPITALCKPTRPPWPTGFVWAFTFFYAPASDFLQALFQKIPIFLSKIQRKISISQ